MNKMNKSGQAIIMNLMFLVLTIAVFMAFIPVIQDFISEARGSDGLNCVSTTSLCNSGDAEPCHNASMDIQTTSCLVLDIYLPYIIIVVLLMGVGALTAQRSGMFGGGQPQQQAYPGY